MRSYFRFLVLVVLILFYVLLWNGCERSITPSKNNFMEIPPAERSPQEKDSVFVIDDIKFKISVYFWQDFMPRVPPGGPPFYLNFKIYVHNLTERPIRGFSAPVATLYYSETQSLFHSFRLIPVATTQPEETILPQEKKRLIYTNDREEIFSPQVEQGTKLYARIMVMWNGKKHLLTSPPAGVAYTF
jgi:hypothetical protein